MIRFVHSEYLYGLLLLPVLAAVYWYLLITRRKAMGRFGELPTLAKIAGESSNSKRFIKLVVLLLAVAMLVVGLANPQIGTRLEEVKQEGVDIFIALDVSLSMKAEDIKPSRLDKAKLELRNLIQKLAGDRIGLIVFAGEAFTQFPLTTDYSAANLFLDAVDVDAVPTPGTSIGSAIGKAVESFNFEDKTTKVIIIITDGEDTEGNSYDAAEEAAKKGILIYTVGLGTPAGSPIPIYNASGQQVDFKRDKAGNVVVTKLDEASLEKLANAASGKYFRGTSSEDELEDIYKNINALQKREFGTKQFTDYEDRFQWFLLPAGLLLLVELFITEKKSRLLARWNLLRKEEEVKV